MTIRIDNYVAPTSWDDLDMDWTDPDPTDCKYIHALILAIKERLVGPSVYDYQVSLPVVSPDIRMKYSTLMAIHNFTFALWSGSLDNQIRYINCDEPAANRTITKTASSSYFNGTYDYHLCDVNYWTDASIIEAIGDDAIVWPQADMFNNKPWLIQQYKILNKMNTHLISLSKNHNAFYKQKYYYEHNGTVYQDFETDWLPDTDHRNAYKKAQINSYEVGHVHDVQAVKFTWSTLVAYPYTVDIIGIIDEYFSYTGTEWAFAPDAFNGVSSIKYWFNPFSYHIPANTIPLIDSQDGDLNFLNFPPQIGQYGSSMSGWQWGAQRAFTDSYWGYPKVIGKFNFNFQSES